MSINKITRLNSVTHESETIFQCKEGFGALINGMKNTDIAPEWLQELRQHRKVTLATKYERYDIKLDESGTPTFKSEKIPLGFSIKSIWYKFTHNAIFSSLFGHTSLDIREKACRNSYYDAIWNEWKNNAPPGENEQRDEAVKRLQVCLKNSGKQLSLNHLNLSVLPELPPSLTWLNITNNKLRELPALPCSLQELFAYNNQLEALSVLPDSLKLLNIFGNRFSVLPTLPDSLKYLDVSRNRLSTLPPLPHSLKKLDLSNNRLTRLPESISHLPRNAEVNVRSNPLSEQTLQDIARINDDLNYQGPQIHFSMARPRVERAPRALSESVMAWFPVNDDHNYQGSRINFSMARPRVEKVIRPLSERVMAWFPDERKESVTAQWSQFNNEENADVFSKFLGRLSDTESMKKVPVFKEQVAAWLTRLVDSPSLRELTFVAAFNATESCEDRVILAYNKMQEVALIHDIRKGSYDNELPGLFSLARELFRVEKLEEIAQEKVKSLRFVDEIEVWLAFQVKLHDILNLAHVAKEMRFFGVSHVTEDDLAAAAVRVKTAEEAGFMDWLSHQDLWQDMLLRIKPEAYQNYTQTRYNDRVKAGLAELGLKESDTDAITMSATATIGKRVMNNINAEFTKKILQERQLMSLLNSPWDVSADVRHAAG